MTTIKDVANLAGVSAGTVSIVLNGKSKERKISDKTQQKVIEAVKILNYHPNVSAKKLRSQEFSNNPVIALYWVSDIRVNFMTRVLKGLQNAIAKLDFNFDIVIRPYKNDFLYLERGIKDNNMFNGAIIANTSTLDMKYLESITPQLPIVLLNRMSKKYCSIYVDNYKMGEKAALLFSKNQHKNVAVILAKSVYLAMESRNMGFIETCNKNKIEVLDEHIIISDNSIEGGVGAAEKFLKLRNPPKAIFCNSDIIALGILYMFNKKGVKVPDDVEIIGVGMASAESTKFSIPPLTVVDVPLEKMALECIKLISDLINHNVKSPTSVLLDTPLIIRDSCKDTNNNFNK